MGIQLCSTYSRRRRDESSSCRILFPSALSACSKCIRESLSYRCRAAVLRPGSPATDFCPPRQDASPTSDRRPGLGGCDRACTGLWHPLLSRGPCSSEVIACSVSERAVLLVRIVEI